MANLISLEKATKAYGPRVLLDGVSLGVADRERIGVVGRTARASRRCWPCSPGVGEPDSGRVARTSRVCGSGYLRQADTAVGTVGELVFGGLAEGRGPGRRDATGPARSRASCWRGDLSLDADAGRHVRRRAAAGRPGRPARRRPRRPAARRADQPPGHRGDRLARPAPARPGHARWSWSATTGGCLTLPASGRGRSTAARCYPHEGGYSAYVLAKAERRRTAEAAEQRRRNLARKELAWLRRGPQARTTKPKFRVEAANALIAGEPPPRDSVELTRLATARLGKTVHRAGGRLAVGRRAASAARRRDLAARPRATGSGSSGSTAAARPPCCNDRSPRRRRSGRGCIRTGTVVRGKTVRIGHLSQELAELDPDQRVREAVEEVRLRIRVGKRELSAGQLLERLGFVGGPAVDPGRRPVRRRAAAAADAPAADGRAERAAARRADQRPRHRDADRVRGPARRLARHAGRGQPRPVLPGTGHRPRGRAARRRQARLPRRRRR